jgi:organic radical activating enzyme
LTTENQRNIAAMQDQMRSVVEQFSPTMCTAKWLQSTIMLYNGHTHSCHHPAPHKIPLEELAGNASALHNTNHKKQARAEMLNGERPAECQYCWNIEDLPGEHLSDRTYKSTTPWSMPFLDRIKDAGAAGDIDPTYVEVAFDTTCNFKCAYCSPEVSSKWMEEIEQHGYYPVSVGLGDPNWLERSGKMPIPQREHNPYIEAFWQWWPTVRDKLHTFRITGGEPLLSKHTWRLLDDIDARPRPDLSLAINTNMGVPEVFIDKLIDYQQRLAPKLRRFDIFTSAEASGPQADYVRFGMCYPTFMQNIRRVLRETNAFVHFMTTFNALSITTFEQFLLDIFELRCQFNPAESFNRVPIMINYLRWPPYLDVRLLPLALRQQAAPRFHHLMMQRTRRTSPNPCGRFYLEEIDQIARLGKFMLSELPEVERYRQDFAKYIIEYDRRRGTDFKKTFPDLAHLLGD